MHNPSLMERADEHLSEFHHGHSLLEQEPSLTIHNSTVRIVEKFQYQY